MKSITGNYKSIILVVIQFSSILFLLFTGKAFAAYYFLLAIEIFGILFVFWAFLSMRMHTLNIFPSVRKTGEITQKGPYKIIRHPMYLSMLFIFVPLLIDEFSYLRLAVFIVLCINLLVKIEFEEKLLKEAYPEYHQYAKKTKKLIPFVY